MNRMYLKNLLISLDQLANALLRGSPDETLSSRAWRMEQKGQPYWKWTRRAIDLLFWFDKDHCRNSYLNELCLHNGQDSKKGAS